MRLAGDVTGLEHGRLVHAAHELAHVVVGRLAQDFLRRAHLHHLAVLHDGHAVADAHGLVQVVRDEDDGAALDLLQAQQLVLHLGADDGVEGREGLVHQQDRRVGRQRARQAHALLHAARQFVGVAGGPHGQAHLLQRGTGGGLAFAQRHAGQLQPEGGVLQHRQMRQQRERLEHHADVLAAEVAQLLVVVLRDVLAVDHDAAGRRLDQAVEHAHQGRFARARQAHDDEDFARLDGETGVEHADRLPGLGHDVLLGDALACQVQRAFGCVAKHLEQVLDHDLLGHGGSSGSSGQPGRGRNASRTTPMTPTTGGCANAGAWLRVMGDVAGSARNPRGGRCAAWRAQQVHLRKGDQAAPESRGDKAGGPLHRGLESREL